MLRDQRSTSISRQLRQQLIVERLLQLIVQTAIDINLQLLLSLAQPIPEDYFDSFIKVSRNSSLSQGLAQRLAPSTGLRNRLVNQYEEIDSRIVWRSILLTLELYPQYIQQVQVYLEQQNAP
ncbi:type VII toxin-antitoxin system HepT family RNase toxin [Leptolyngbya sp. FACHB-261]|uniref:type VII toxin-antitoxin system HepT family RNase toxin n=1 Tax=Leptolyngbya sp. FACHB-261 TaxID=2692806 RepID=UPI0037C0A6DD